MTIANADVRIGMEPPGPEPQYQCRECWKVMPKSEALDHHVEKGHPIKRLDDKKQLDIKPQTK